MLNKKLLREMQQERKYLLLAVLIKVFSLLTNVFMIFESAFFIERLMQENYSIKKIVVVFLGVIILQVGLSRASAYVSYKLSVDLKKKLRLRLFRSIYDYGIGYARHISPAESIQLSVEGIEQLDIYYSKFIPQFIFSMLSPILLFIILLPLNHTIALVLFLIVPLIPLSIVMVQKLAKKITKNYWGSFVKLSDLFLDLLKGMTTLKVYQADGIKNDEMNQISENFRKNTMKVLAIQLNNITLMDIVAFGGAAFGALYSVYLFAQGTLPLAHSIIFILISAEFFLPLRLLGSFFHIAMNGMAASDKLFEILDTPKEDGNTEKLEGDTVHIELKNLSFQYQADRAILDKVSIHISPNQLTALVGESGCGKSTVAGLIMGNYEPQSGELLINGKAHIANSERIRHFTKVDHAPYIFAGTVRDNLLMGNPNACEEEMWNALEQVKLKDFLLQEDGLNTRLEEQAQNFSGGQKQRLAIARALLKESKLLIFDEASSNIDIESENAILDLVQNLKSKKTILLITHRLRSAAQADAIYVMENGRVLETGTFESLQNKHGKFQEMYEAQSSLEDWGLQNA